MNKEQIKTIAVVGAIGVVINLGVAAYVNYRNLKASKELYKKQLEDALVENEKLINIIDGKNKEA